MLNSVNIPQTQAAPYSREKPVFTYRPTRLTPGQ